MRIASRRIALGAAALALVTLAASGCGGSKDETSSTATWADGLCSAATTYRQSVRDAVNTVKNGTVSKAALEDAANQVSDATDTFASTVKGLGKPDTKSGATVKSTIDGLASDLQKDASTIADAAGGTLLNAVSVASTTLLTAQDQITSALKAVQQADAGGELQQAFSQADSCASFTGA